MMIDGNSNTTESMINSGGSGGAGGAGGKTNISIVPGITNIGAVLTPAFYLILVVLTAAVILGGVFQISTIVYFSHIAQASQREMVAEVISAVRQEKAKGE